MPASDKLTDPHLCIVFSYAPAGLGHLRVTKALLNGLPPGTHPILLPDTAASVQYFHRLTSINPLAKKIFEWAQYGKPEDIFTRTYRSILQKDSNILKSRLLEILKQRVELPTTLLVVATHFGIAHQLSTIKAQIEQQAGVRVLLVTQVTDDSPQKMWYVPNADILVTPSDKTKKLLKTYGESEQLGKSHLIDIPYPVSPLLTEPLLPEEFDNKIRQAKPEAHTLIHIAIPISGAAVGMPYINEVMKELHRIEPRIRFHIIGKRTLYTLPFFRLWERRHYVTLYQSHSDRQVVELYEEAYQRVPILLEISKPSEQTFKTLLDPQKRGGSILLFTNPVGRQEYDNLDFLRRHHLIPDDREELQLYDVLNLSQKRFSLPIRSWRGFSLSTDPKLSAKWISRSISLRIFELMLLYKNNGNSKEVQPTGVEQFWKEVRKLL